MFISRVLSRYSSYCVLNRYSFIQLNSMHSIVPKRLFIKQRKNLLPFSSKRFSSYEGDGKTVAVIINKKDADVLLVTSVSQEGFILANGTQLVGSMVLFPHSIMSWHVTRAQDITEESLVLFKLFEPKIDILVLGYGARKDYTPEVQKKFSSICKKLGIIFEALPTEQAVGVFNFLSEERRLVAGAFIPPSHIDKLKLDRRKDYYLISEEEEGEEERLKSISGDKSQQKLIK